MKSGYTIRHHIKDKNNTFYLHNFNSFNEVVYFGFTSGSVFKKLIAPTCIGVWKIKSTPSSK